MASSPRHGLVVVACLALSALVLTTLPTASDVVARDANQVKSELRQTGEALDSANKRVSRAMRAYNRANAALPQARRALEQARKREARAMRDETEANANTRKAASALQANRARQLVTRERQTTVRNRMALVARTMYQRGPFGEVEVVLSATDPGDFVLRLAAADSIGRSQAGVEDELAQIEADLVLQEVEREALKAEADREERRAQRAVAEAKEARQQAVEARAKVQSLVTQRKGAAQRAKQHRAAVQARYQRLKVEQARIQRAAARAAREAARRAQAQGTPTGMTTPQGSLRWPVDGGRISSHVGARRHPVFGYASCHTGLDVAAPTGTPIRAAASGVVSLVSSGGPYGNAVLVAHADGLTTFYAHMSSIAVSRGQQVQTGALLGAVGSTGWSTGPHLHFETRINGNAYNPMGWFGGSRSPVGC